MSELRRGKSGLTSLPFAPPSVTVRGNLCSTSTKDPVRADKGDVLVGGTSIGDLLGPIIVKRLSSFPAPDRADSVLDVFPKSFIFIQS